MKKLIFAFLLLSCLPSFGETISLTMENDIFDNSDSNYTHGTQVAYKFGNKIIRLSQIMYTPKDISLTEYIEGDRPYAGTSFLNYGQGNLKDNTYIYFEGGIGFLGERSRAGDTQKFVHKAFDNREPKGWDNQVEKGLIATFGGKIKTKHVNKDFFQIISSTKFEVGGLWDYFGVGLEPRLGFNIKDEDFDDHIIQPFNFNPLDYLSFYFYGILDAKNVLYNATLEEVEKKPLIFDYGGGFKLNVSSAWINFSHVWRSREFENGPSDEGYSSITLGYDF